jgi:hypothetical protein
MQIIPVYTVFLLPANQNSRYPEGRELDRNSSLPTVTFPFECQGRCKTLTDVIQEVYLGAT